MFVSFTGGKGTTIDWATAQMTTFDDPGKSRGYKGKRSSPSPQGLCTASAVLRMVRRTIFCIFFAISCSPRMYLFISDQFIAFFAIFPFTVNESKAVESVLGFSFTGKL